MVLFPTLNLMLGRKARWTRYVASSPARPQPDPSPKRTLNRCFAATFQMQVLVTNQTNSVSKEAHLNSLRFAANKAAAEAPSPSGTPILSQRQLAEYLGLCERSVRNLERRGVIPRIKLGKRTVYRLDSILAALARLEQEGRAA